MAEAVGIRAWLCHLIQQALERILGARRLNSATSADHELLSIRGSTKLDERQTERLTATNDPPSSSDSSPASDAMATSQDRKAASGDKTHPGLSSPGSALETLRVNIENVIVHRDLHEEFAPESALKRLMSNRIAITKTLEELRSNSTQAWETPIEDLVSFIAKDAYKVFPLLIRQEVSHLIEQFYRYRCDFRQEMLPVKLSKSSSTRPTIESYDEASRPREGLNCDILGDVFDIESAWQRCTLRDFCLTWQWSFFPPVFVEEKFHYSFPDRTRLPFTRYEETPRNDSSCYSTLDKKSIHNDHIQTTITLSRDEKGNPLVALKMLKSDDADEAKREAVALETINGFKSKHFIKTLAHFQLQSDNLKTKKHYFIFPWTERGNLWEFWQRHDPGTDRKYMLDVFRQLAGLACAIDELSSRGIRHGDLKPENILCFEDEDGLPEGGSHPSGAAVRLVITDVGLARVHRDTTAKRGVTNTRVSTKRYAGPEMSRDPKKLSRRFDIWSMGCLYLEFLIWVLYGKDKLDKFSDEPQGRKEKARFYEKVGDRRLQVPETETQGSFQVHRAAREWMSKIRGDERCSNGTAFRYLVDLISDKLLVVDLGNREAPEAQAPKGASHGEEKIDPNPRTGAPGLRTEPATSPTDDNTNKSEVAAWGRVYAPDMKDGLMKIVDGLADESVIIKESALPVRGSSGPKNGETPTNGSVNDRVRN